MSKIFIRDETGKRVVVETVSEDKLVEVFKEKKTNTGNKRYKIWLLTNYENNLKDPSSSPTNLDYKTGLNIRLQPRVIIHKGELQKVEYYSQFDGTTYNDLILEVGFEWTRNEEGTLTKRKETRTWFYEDDSPGPDIKITEKFYTKEMAASADQRRRTNIVEHMTSLADQFGVLHLVQAMFITLDNELNAYEKTGDRTLILSIGSYNGDWLDNLQFPGTPYSLRQIIMSELDV